MRSNKLSSLGSNVFRSTLPWQDYFHQLAVCTVNFDQQDSMVKLYGNYIQLHSNSTDILKMIVDISVLDQDYPRYLHVKVI